MIPDIESDLIWLSCCKICFLSSPMPKYNFCVFARDMVWGSAPMHVSRSHGIQGCTT